MEVERVNNEGGACHEENLCFSSGSNDDIDCLFR